MGLAPLHYLVFYIFYAERKEEEKKGNITLLLRTVSTSTPLVFQPQHMPCPANHRRLAKFTRGHQGASSINRRPISLGSMKLLHKR